jgi:PAS domain S-box-containing protein
MGLLARLPLRRKLTAFALTAAAAALLLSCTAFVVYDVVTFRASLVRRLTTQAEIAGRQSAASLLFEDPETANAILGALGADPRLLSAAIYTPDRRLFARYARTGAEAGGGLLVSRPIEFDGRVIGSIDVRSDLAEITDRLQRYALIALLVLLASMGVAHGIAALLQRVITEPVRRLSEAALKVSANEDYSVRAVATSDDEIGRLIVAFNAMLEQIQARDRALHASEEQYRLLFYANPHPMWVYDPTTLAFAAVNDAAVRLYGYTREEFLAMTIKDIRPASDVPALVESLAAGPGKGSDTVWRHLKKDGTAIDVSIASSGIEFLGQPARFVLATDVSEQRGLEAQLLQAQKMEAVGRLAGGVAHDFNNLLGVITGYTGLLDRSLSPNDAVAHNRVDQIRKAAERATALTRQLLAFSRKEVIQPKVLDLNEVVHDVEKMLQRLIGEDVTLTTKLEADLGRVKADRGQIDQVMVNLAVNARDAMPNGGQLILETANTVLDEPYARSHPGVLPGPYVVLTVSDTGHGMDAATRSRIFEPFFTTKTEGEGTGLGLSTVFGIAKQSGGPRQRLQRAGAGERPSSSTCRAWTRRSTPGRRSRRASGSRLRDAPAGGGRRGPAHDDQRDPDRGRLRRPGGGRSPRGARAGRGEPRATRSGADRRDHAGDVRSRPGEGRAGDRSRHRGRLHVGLHERGGQPPGRAATGDPLPPEAVHLGRPARCDPRRSRRLSAGARILDRPAVRDVEKAPPAPTLP